MDQWRDISTADNKIMDGRSVVVWSKGKSPVVAYFSQATALFPNLGWQSIPGDKRYHPTHYVPLPDTEPVA